MKHIFSLSTRGLTQHQLSRMKYSSAKVLLFALKTFDPRPEGKGNDSEKDAVPTFF